MPEAAETPGKPPKQATPPADLGREVLAAIDNLSKKFTTEVDRLKAEMAEELSERLAKEQRKFSKLQEQFDDYKKTHTKRTRTSSTKRSSSGSGGSLFGS